MRIRQAIQIDAGQVQTTRDENNNELKEQQKLSTQTEQNTHTATIYNFPSFLARGSILIPSNFNFTSFNTFVVGFQICTHSLTAQLT